MAEAEDAFQNRLGVLQASVDDLLGSLDARTHGLLLKMRAQLDACQRENRELKERVRVEHIAAIDRRNAATRAAEASAAEASATRAEAQANATSRAHAGQPGKSPATRRSWPVVQGAPLEPPPVPHLPPAAPVTPSPPPSVVPVYHEGYLASVPPLVLLSTGYFAPPQRQPL